MSHEYLETTVGKFIFRVRVGYLYTEGGLWVDVDEATRTARVGLTDYSQQSSGDVAFVELPQVGTEVAAGQPMAAIETIKVDLEVPAPLHSTVVAANAQLVEAPELINQDPYGEGWLVLLAPAAWPVAGLLDAAAYLAVMTRQAEAEA